MNGWYILIAVIVLLIAIILTIYFVIRHLKQKLRTWIMVSSTDDLYTQLCEDGLPVLAKNADTCAAAAKAVGLPMDTGTPAERSYNCNKIHTNDPINREFNKHLAAERQTTINIYFLGAFLGEQAIKQLKASWVKDADGYPTIKFPLDKSHITFDPFDLAFQAEVIHDFRKPGTVLGNMHDPNKLKDILAGFEKNKPTTLKNHALARR